MPSTSSSLSSPLSSLPNAAVASGPDAGAGTGGTVSAAGAAPAFLPSERFSVAPMVDVTDSVFRQMARILTSKAMLYTEMIAAEALIHGRSQLLDFEQVESPVCLQLGGCDPQKLFLAAKIGAARGYDALNLNAGCPSDKVQSGNFGAILMKTPEFIAACYQAMVEGVAAAGKSIPVSVKTRIGVDELDSREFTFELMGKIYEAGCRHIIVHARKAWLHGLSPKENRTVPPLDYQRVYDLKAAYPDLYITINGGIVTMEQCHEHLQHVDGVMLGRAVIDNPFLLTQVDSAIFGEKERVFTTADELIEPLMALGQKLEREGRAVHFLYRHLLGLFVGQPGARLYRRYLSEHMNQKGAGAAVLGEAYAAMLQARAEQAASAAQTVSAAPAANAD